MNASPLPPPPAPIDELTHEDQVGLLDITASLLWQYDRLMADITLNLVRMRERRAVGECTGLTDIDWLQHVARLRAIDARRMLRQAKDLERVPLVLECLRQGALSHSQATEVASAIRKAPADQRDLLDARVAELAGSRDIRDWWPDDLIEAVWRRVDELSPSVLEKEEARADRSEFLAITPFLFGGGSIYAELGTEHFALACEALDAVLSAPTLGRDTAGDLSDDEIDASVDRLDVERRALARTHGAALAARFVELCESGLQRPATAGGMPRAPRPTAILTIDVDSLLCGDTIPGWLLTTLTGGRMRTSANLQRRMIDERGADIRLVVLDEDSDVVGVGDRSYTPPQWLREAIWARDTHDRSPSGHTAVRRCDLDHIVPWKPPPGSNDPPGPTNADNLQPIGRRGHSGKTSGKWTASRARDGTTTWTHAPTGFTISRPATRSLKLAV